MCGIVGIYNLPEASGKFPLMLRRLSHRGPDAEGTYSHRNNDHQILLGHRRLSIIDLSEISNQPMEKNGLVIVFNGEIYNYKDLSRQLQAKGIVFKTKSDTEVVLEAWRHWGPNCLQYLRGMFAFGLFEVRTGKLYLARDQFGIKPLFYSHNGESVVFASELKAILPALPIIAGNVEIDHSALVASLMYVWVPESKCAYKNVEKFPAGYWAEFGPDGHFALKCFWSAKDELFKSDAPEATIDLVRSTIEDSVKAHLVADVPVSTFLSGGLDSSLITVLAARHVGNIDSYTIKFRDIDNRYEAMPSDLNYARKVASRYGIHLHEVELNPDVAKLLPEMVSILGEPLGDAAAINTYLICKAARAAGVKVLLSGMGADELFGGYRKHYACMLAAKYQNIPLFVRQKLLEPIINHLPVAGRLRGYRTFRWAKRFMQFANLPEEPAFRKSYTYYSEYELRKLLRQDLWPEIDNLISEHSMVYGEGPIDDQVNRMCYTDLKMFLPGLNLAYSDRASMAASTEIRVPFVDKEVVSTAFRTSGSQKIVGSEGKSILKKAAEAWLPKEIIYRPKAPFGAPLRAWVRRDLREMVDDVLIGGRLCTDMLNPAYVHKMIDDDRAGVADNAQRIWHLLTLEFWCKNVENVNASK